MNKLWTLGLDYICNKQIFNTMKKLFILALSLGAFSAVQAQNVDAAGNEIKSNSNQSGQPAITTSTSTQTPAVTPAATPAVTKPACAGSAAASGEVKSCCKAKTASAAGTPACAGAGTAAAGQTKACCKDKAAGTAAASSCAGHAHTGDAANGNAQKPACNKPCTGHAAQPATTPVQPNNQ